MTENEVLNQEQELEPSADEVSTEVEDDSFADMLFDGEVDIPTTETEEHEEIPSGNEVKEDEKVETDVPQVAESTAQEQSPFMTIKYNKESKNLTQEEAIAYAQKGMNYDNIYERYTAMKNDEPTINELRHLADANGMSLIDFTNQLKDFQRNMELDKELEALKQQYPNSDEELLKEVANAHLTDKATMISKKQQESINAKKQEISRQMDIFNSRYPDLDASKLDKGVYELMKNGYTLLEAYESVEADKRAIEKEKQDSLAKAERLNQENRRKSLGNTNSNGDAKEEDDLINILFS